MPTNQSDLSRVALRISGRVQGVGFRYSALDTAQRLGLKGWVRNTADGDVEITAEGSHQVLQQLIDWCRHGPRGALVTNVQERWQSYSGEFDEFRITR